MTRRAIMTADERKDLDRRLRDRILECMRSSRDIDTRMGADLTEYITKGSVFRVRESSGRESEVTVLENSVSVRGWDMRSILARDPEGGESWMDAAQFVEGEKISDGEDPVRPKDSGDPARRIAALTMVMTEVMNKLESSPDLTFLHELDVWSPVTGRANAEVLKEAAEWLLREGGNVTLHIPFNYFDEAADDTKESRYVIDIRGSELSVSNNTGKGRPGPARDVKAVFREELLRITGIDVFPDKAVTDDDKKSRAHTGVLIMLMTEILSDVTHSDSLVFRHELTMPWKPMTGGDIAETVREAAKWLLASGRAVAMRVRAQRYDYDNGAVEDCDWLVTVDKFTLSVETGYDMNAPDFAARVKAAFRDTVLRMTGIDVFPVFPDENNSAVRDDAAGCLGFITALDAAKDKKETKK